MINSLAQSSCFSVSQLQTVFSSSSSPPPSSEHSACLCCSSVDRTLDSPAPRLQRCQTSGMQSQLALLTVLYKMIWIPERRNFYCLKSDQDHFNLFWHFSILVHVHHEESLLCFGLFSTELFPGQFSIQIFVILLEHWIVEIGSLTENNLEEGKLKLLIHNYWLAHAQ